MSRTISVGVVGPSRWAYMASVMEGRLEKIARERRVEPDAFPPRVYDTAREFFDLALQAVTDEVPDNPPASLNAYVIAARVMRKSSSPSMTRQQVRDMLGRYEELIRSLRTPHELTDAETEMIEPIRRFFLQLRRDGESEMYEASVAEDVTAFRSTLV